VDTKVVIEGEEILEVVIVALLVNVCVDIVDVVGRVVDGVLMVSGCVDVVDVVTCGCDWCGRQLCGCGGCGHESGGRVKCAMVR